MSGEEATRDGLRYNTFDDEGMTRNALDEAVWEHERNRGERYGTGFERHPYNKTDRERIMSSITHHANSSHRSHLTHTGEGIRRDRVQDSADSSITGNWSEPNHADGWTTVPKSHHTRRREEQDIF